MLVTVEILDRVASRRFGFSDPCVICGVPFNHCPHDINETQEMIRRVKQLGAKGRLQLRRTAKREAVSK